MIRREYVRDLASSLLSKYLDIGSVEFVPPAVYRPVIDGRYTPLEKLEVTNIGESLPWKNEVKDEWDDALEVKWEIAERGEYENTEWYSRFKHDEKWLYMLIDCVSDTEVGKVVGNKDKRQWFDLTFDTKKCGITDPGTEGVYDIGFEFTSPTNLAAGNLLPGVPPPGIPLNRKYFKYNWSKSESPHSSVPHIIIESAFDLKLLTKYSNDILLNFYGNDMYFNAYQIYGIFNLSDPNTQPIPDLTNPALVTAASIGIFCLLYKKLTSNKKVSRREYLLGKG